MDHESASDRWDPRAYERDAGFVSAAGQSLVDWLRPVPGERILDLGCGTGTLAQVIAGRGAEVVGVDASPAMIAAARAAYPDLSFEVRPGEALGFDRAFDAIFSNAALHWMRPPEQVASQMGRALRRGGRLVAELGGFGNTGRLLGAVNGALAEIGGAGPASDGVSAADRTGAAHPARVPTGFAHPWYFPRLGEYAALLETAGLEVRDASLFDRPTPVADQPGRSGVGVWLSTFAADLLAAIGPERLPRFLEAVERRCRTELFRDGAWWIDYVRLRVSATELGD